MRIRSSLINRISRIALTVITIPLLLGGLIAIGEAGDGRVLSYGAVSLLALCASMAADAIGQPEREEG